MIFSEGDLIVLGIMFLVLFLFRRLDKRRKDLEKVRRYSEKVQAHLDQIFQDKEQQMKDLSINFEVQEKTYREILKRIQTAREDLQGREESLADLMSRLEGFDERINGLYQLTSKVDENMIRLRDESEYVDNLGLRLKELQKYSSTLEKSIKEMNGDFSRQNLANLEQMKLSLLDDFQARLEIINEDLSRKGADLEEFQQNLLSYRETSNSLKEERLEDLRSRLSELEQDYAQRLNSAAQRGLDLEDQVFRQLEEKIEEKKSSLENNWFKGISELKEEVANRVIEIREDAAKGDQALTEQKERVETLLYGLGDLEQRMESVQDSVTEARSDAMDSLKGSMDDMVQRIESELSSKKRDLEESFEEPLAFREEMGQSLDKLQLQLKQLMEDQDTLRLDSSSKIQQEMDSLRERLEELRRESLENLHTSVKDKQDSILLNMDTRFQDFSENLSQLSGRMETVRDEVITTREESLNSLRDHITRFQEEMSGAVTERKEQVLNEIDQWHQELSGKMNHLWTGLESTNLEAQQGLEERILSYEKELNGKYDRFQKLMAELDQYEDNLSETLGNLESATTERTQSRLESFEEQMKARFLERRDELELLLQEWKGGIGQRLEDVESEEKEAREALEKQIREESSELMLETKKQLIQDYSKLRTDSSDMVDNIRKRVEDSEEGIEVLRQSMEARIQQYQELTEQYQQDMNSQLDRLNEKTIEETRAQLNETQGRIQQDYNQLRDKSEAIAEGIKERLEGSDQEVLTLRQDIEERLNQYREWTEQQFTGLEGNLLGFKERTGNEIEEASSTLQDLENRIEALKEAAMESAQRRFGSLEKTLVDDMTSREAGLKEQISQWEEGFRSDLNALGEKSSGSLEDMQNTLAGKLDERISLYQQGLTENYKDLLEQASLYTSKVDQALEKGDSRLAEYQDNWSQQTDMMKNQAGDFSSSMEKALGELNGLREQYESQNRAFQQNLTDKIHEVEGEMESRLQKTAQGLDLLSKELEQEAMKKIEIRQGEYESTINSRFDRLEALTEDLDQLDSSLRLTLSDQEERLQDDMEQFHQGIREQQEKEQENSNQRLSDVRRIISQVEGELNQLKTQAYDNVSEKLQLFEDDFFSTLKAREGAMKEGFEQWQKTIDLQMEELSSQTIRSREELERNYQSQFKRKFHEIQSRVLEQMNKFQEQVQGFQDNLVVQIEDNEQNFLSHRQSVKEDLQKVKEDSLAVFHQEFEQHQQSTQDLLARHDKEVGMKLDSLSSDIDGNRSELTALITSSRNDISQWQNRVLAQLKNQQSEVERDMGDFQSQITGTIEELREDFHSQKDDLILTSSQERAELRKDLAELSEEAIALKDELAARTDQSLSRLQQEGENFFLDFQARSRDLQVESDERIKAVRQSLQDTKDRMDGLQRQLQSQIEEDYGVLATNLEEMGRQQQEFIASTRIFDQAETMKAALEKDLEDLRQRTATLERSRQELAPMEEEYTRLLKAYQDVSQRMNHFFSEKQKIDLLDGKVARISNLSEAIDVKLEQIDGTNDMLQEFLVRVRQLEDLHGDIAKRYQGLEKKAVIVDATTVGVEKNLQILSHIEKGLKSIGHDLEPMKSDLSSIKASNQQLIEEKEIVDNLVASLGSLDETMLDLENRQQRMDKAREWLASTETRLEKIGKEAQEKVRLLGSLVEKDSKKGTRKTGSPDMNTREMVIQLARQGWSSEEIARQVKLSRGEVELILELSPPEE